MIGPYPVTPFDGEYPDYPFIPDPITLDWELWKNQCVINKRVQDECINIEQYIDKATGAMIYELNARFLKKEGNKLSCQFVAEFPANVWEHFKDRHMPQWYKRRNPVRHTYKVQSYFIDHKVVFPWMDKLPEELGSPVTFQTIERRRYDRR